MRITKLFSKKPSKTLKDYKEIYATLTIIALICFMVTAIDRFFLKKEEIIILAWKDAEVALLICFITHAFVSLLYGYLEMVFRKNNSKAMKKKNIILILIFRGIAFLSALWYAWCVTLEMF